MFTTPQNPTPSYAPPHLDIHTIIREYWCQLKDFRFALIMRTRRDFKVKLTNVVWGNNTRLPVGKVICMHKAILIIYFYMCNILIII